MSPRREGLHGAGMVSAMRAGGAAVMGGSSMLDNLIAYWPGDEAAGNLIDAHTNSIDLTDVGGVGNAGGLVYPTARSYTGGAFGPRFELVFPALVQVSDYDFTIMLWMYPTNTSQGYVMSPSLANVGWRMNKALTSRLVSFEIYNGGAWRAVQSTTFGGLPTNAWSMVTGYHDAQNDWVGIQVNAGAIDTLNVAGGATAGAGNFRHGSGPGGVPVGVAARMAPTAIWRSDPGMGGKLSAAQMTWLYNGGSGRQYSELAAGPGA